MTRNLLRSFAAGIIAPELYGRLDLTKFQTGLAECRNFWVLPHGPVQNRPGLEYVLEANDSAHKVRLIPFAYSTDQTFVLEFGHQYIRFHTAGATLLETGLAVTAVTQASPGVLTYTGTDPANGDWFYLAGLGGMTELNGRYVKVANVNAGANTFELTDIHGGANISTTGFGAYTSGGTASRVYTIISPYDEVDLFDIHFTQSADVLTLVHPGYAPRELRRMSATEWTLSTIAFTPSVTAPATDGATPTPISHSYKVAAVLLVWDQAAGMAMPHETLPSSVASANNDFTVTGSYNILTWASVPNASSYNIYKLSDGVYGYLGASSGARFIDDARRSVTTSRAPEAGATYPAPTGLVVGATASGGAVTATPTGTGSTSYSYVVTSVSADGLEESFPTNAASCSNNLATAGNYNTITWAAVAGITRYNVYKLSNGLYGYIGQSGGVSFVDNNIIADISTTPPNASAPFETASNYPGAIGYHDQRRCFGGTDNAPQNFWATRSATEANLSYSIPTRDNDAIAFRVAAREVNRIRHIVSLDQLLFLTSGGEWKVAPQNSDILTPNSAAPKQIAAEGASNVQPIVTGNSVIYVQESGSRWREMKYRWEVSNYDVRDASIMAPQLFDQYTTVDMAYSKTPNKMVWGVRSDGTLIGLTYLPEHEVMGYHQHDTDGLFESVAAVKEGSEHALYVVVNRTINGRTVRYIERMHSRQFAAAEDAFFVDAGLTYDSTSTTTVTGLWHLEGEEVAVLADAAVHPLVTVTGGAITLEAAASVVQVGLPIVADVKTLPLSLEAQAFGQGLQKNVNGVALRVNETSGLLVGPTFDAAEMESLMTRSDEAYGTPPALRSGVIDVTVMPAWGDDAQVCIRQNAPLPATILSMTVNVAVGG